MTLYHLLYLAGSILGFCYSAAMWIVFTYVKREVF
jgi:hypothetical protein